MKINLSKEELFEAVRDGVKEAILEMTECTNIIRTAQFMEKIREGTQDAIWQIATNATSSPCIEFYDAIKSGVEKAMEFKDL